MFGPTTWSPPTVLGDAVLRHALLWLTFCFSLSAGSFALLNAGLEGSLRLPYIHMAATARDLVHNSRLLLQSVMVLDSCQLSAEGGCQSDDCSDVVSSAYPSHIFA